MRPAQPLRTRGFTLIELLVVLAILGLLLTAARPLQQVVQQRAQEQALREALRGLRTALDQHRDAVQARRVAPAVPGSPWPASLAALVEGLPLLDETGLPRADGARLYLLRRLPRDPFAERSLPAEQTWALRASSSPPDAPAAGEDVFDVRSRAKGRALDGSLYADW